MIGSILLAATSPQFPQVVAMPKVAPRSRPLYEVACDLKSLDFDKSYRVVLLQYGGIYSQKAGEAYGGRSPTYAKFSRDDLGIFDDKEIDLTGSRITEWYSDGPFELISRNGRGGYTFYKTAKTQSFWDSPTKVAVTVKGGRIIPNVAPDKSIEEFMLVGTCRVSWTEQKPEGSAVQEHGINK